MNKITLLVLSVLSLLGVGVGSASADAVPLYRYENQSTKEVLLSATPWELSNQWVRKETVGVVYDQQYAGVVPLYRYVNAGIGDHFYTTDYNELRDGAAGWVARGVGAYVYDHEVPNAIPLYRFSNPQAKHYFTTNRAEGESKPGYYFERIAAWIFPAWSQTGTTQPRDNGGPVIVPTNPGQPTTPSNPSGGPSIGGTTRSDLGNNPIIDRR